MPDTQPKPFVFVLMPFDKSFDDIYTLGIKAACHDAGAYSERVDEQKYDGSILERVYNQIAKADLLIADMTGKNPNVFYEVGYAHALGKRVILLTQRSEDIPFDLKHYPHIVYEGSITGLKEQLLPKAKWAIENPKGKSQVFEPTLELRINGFLLNNNPEIIAKRRSNAYFYFNIEMFNSPKRVIEELSFKIGLIVLKPLGDAEFATRDNEDSRLAAEEFRLEDGRAIYLIEKWFTMTAGEWQRFHGTIFVPNPKADPIQCGIQVLSKGGPVEIPFRFKFQV